jgi:hypothetical protein
MSTTTNNTAPALFCGWVRQGGSRSRWKLFCRQQTEDAVWSYLLDCVPRGTDKTVTRGTLTSTLRRST